MLFRGGSDDAAVASDDDSTRSAGANVHPEYVDRASSTADVAHPRYWKRSLSHFVGHEEERAHFEAGVLRAEAAGVVLLLDVDDLLGGGNSFERDVVVVAVLEYDETAADTLQQEIESEITVSHRSDRVNGVGVAAANEITELLIDDVDFLAIIEFSGNFPDFFADNFADASELFVAVGVGGFPLKDHFSTFEYGAFRDEDDGVAAGVFSGIGDEKVGEMLALAFVLRDH